METNKHKTGIKSPKTDTDWSEITWHNSEGGVNKKKQCGTMACSLVADIGTASVKYPGELG